ncbi:hypothetical protein DSM104443_04282 [Usitatibacter rugosus]|uniref:Cytochrome c domain-containing protein n=1 Tax=Usitatibacter rugosus TaxID=2732067 RepID=A0A6M4H5J4_9PROT|nr:c-type cytochrome [Usitatibacter rugosus]QJR13187.1 hypothetical protein DSM104443_04282 [Usitatibacter rugosus]
MEKRTPFTAMALMLVAATFTGLAQSAEPQAPAARGKYLVEIAGCNDCHTPNYAMASGKTPESEWLTGDALGWQGPWGTTYASNLRLYMKDKSEAQWIEAARNLRARPPMPWFNVAAMSDADLKSIYAYVKSLPVAGSAAPSYVPPGVDPQGPVVRFPAPPANVAGK